MNREIKRVNPFSVDRLSDFYVWNMLISEYNYPTKYLEDCFFESFFIKDISVESRRKLYDKLGRDLNNPDINPEKVLDFLNEFYSGEKIEIKGYRIVRFTDSLGYPSWRFDIYWEKNKKNLKT